MSSPDRSRRPLPVTAVVILVGVCAVWGLNLVSIKISNPGFPPLHAVALRNSVAALVIGTWVYLRRETLFHRDRRLFHGVVIGIMFGLDFMFLYWGSVFTHASRAIVFLYTYPFWVALGAHIFLPRERLTRGKVTGLVLAFIGVVVVFASRQKGLEPGYWIGDGMEVVAALFWAATTVYIKAVIEDNDIGASTVLFYQLFFSVPILITAVAIFEWPAAIDLTVPVVSALLYQSVIVASVSYMVWFWLIHKYEVSVLAAFILLVPLFGVLGSRLVLGEEMAVRLLLGLALVVAGILLVNRRMSEIAEGEIPVGLRAEGEKQEGGEDRS